MLKYYIKYIFLLIFTSIWSQNEIQKDSIGSELRYGFRFGVDMSKPIRMLIEEGYKGLEFVGDYRLTKDLYIAGELGNETKNINQDGVHFETAGTYLKLGIDYNVFNNWKGMDNLILVGFRYGLSQHKQTLLGYSRLINDRYWQEDNIITLDEPLTYEGLNGHWIEFQFGIKAELLRNLYMGITIQMHRLLSDKDPENFENLFIPGFNKVLTNNPYGAGLNHTISYQIPVFKK